MRLTIGLVLLLAACAAAPEPPPPEPVLGQRDQLVPISSTTRGTPDDMGGNWIVAQALAGGAVVRPGDKIRLSQDQDAWVWAIGEENIRVRLSRQVTLPGRYVPGPSASGSADQPQQELWVLWVDDDFRTAVIGTPDGSIGWIMNRPGQASGDRTRAAQEILDFNGYDPADFAG